MRAVDDYCKPLYENIRIDSNAEFLCKWKADLKNEL